MYRFSIASGGERSHVEAADADARHVLAALGLPGKSATLDAADLQTRASRLVRAIDQGRGKDFTRSPDSPTDDGMDEFEVKALALALADVAVAAAASGGRVGVVRPGSAPAA